MPRNDGTGPFGKGPMSGRGFGRCGSRYESQRLNLTKEERMKILEGEKEEIEKTLKRLKDEE